MVSPGKVLYCRYLLTQVKQVREIVRQYSYTESSTEIQTVYHCLKTVFLYSYLLFLPIHTYQYCSYSLTRISNRHLRVFSHVFLSVWEKFLFNKQISLNYYKLFLNNLFYQSICKKNWQWFSYWCDEATVYYVDLPYWFFIFLCWSLAICFPLFILWAFCSRSSLGVLGTLSGNWYCS